MDIGSREEGMNAGYPLFRAQVRERALVARALWQRDTVGTTQPDRRHSFSVSAQALRASRLNGSALAPGAGRMSQLGARSD
jgi:hypothetical protein